MMTLSAERLRRADCPWVPELFDEMEGCPFAPRCEYAAQRCREEKPRLAPRQTTGGRPHLAACHYAEGGQDHV